MLNILFTVYCWCHSQTNDMARTHLCTLAQHGPHVTMGWHWFQFLKLSTRHQLILHDHIYGDSALLCACTPQLLLALPDSVLCTSEKTVLFCRAYETLAYVTVQTVRTVANTNSLTYFPVSTHGYARLNWPGLLAIYQDGVGELINNLASAAHRQTICVHHYRLTGPVMTLPLTLKTFSAMPTQMMNICDTFHWNLSTD